MARPIPRPESFDGADRFPLERARARAGGLVNTLRLSTALAGARRPVDMSGLEAAVGLLCAKALDLDPAQGRLLLPDLSAVLEELALLTATLAEQRPPAP